MVDHIHSSINRFRNEAIFCTPKFTMDKIKDTATVSHLEVRTRNLT